MQQDLIGRLLERKPARRLGMLNGRANDIKKHKWFEGLDWEALEARKITPLRKPKEDSAKRLKELTVSVTAQPCTLGLCITGPLICSESTGSGMHSMHSRNLKCAIASASSSGCLTCFEQNCSSGSQFIGRLLMCPETMLSMLHSQAVLQTKQEVYCRITRRSKSGSPKRLQKSCKSVKWSLLTFKLCVHVDHQRMSQNI